MHVFSFSHRHVSHTCIFFILYNFSSGSTDAVFPTGLHDCSEDDDVTSYSTQLHDGYSQTKWVAEQLVRRARQRGIPVTIYRLGKQILCLKKLLVKSFTIPNIVHQSESFTNKCDNFHQPNRKKKQCFAVRLVQISITVM